LPHKVFAACFFGISLQCDFCFVISIVGGRTLQRENISLERPENFASVFAMYTFSSQIFFSRYFKLGNSSSHPDFSISHLLPFCLDIDLTRFCRINGSVDRLGSSGKISSTAENTDDDSGSVLHPSALALSSVPSLYETVWSPFNTLSLQRDLRRSDGRLWSCVLGATEDFIALSASSSCCSSSFGHGPGCTVSLCPTPPAARRAAALSRPGRITGQAVRCSRCYYWVGC